MSPKRLHSFYLSPELGAALDRLKQQTGASKGEIIRRALAEYVKKQETASRRVVARRKV